jgi:hypothetical protein
MRLAVLCVALSCWAPVAAAQVSFVRHQVEDERVARALEKLIGEPVQLVDAAPGGSSPAASAARFTVSIDRQRGVLRVVTPESPAGLARALDPNLLADSPYAVALAAAELLELSSVETRRSSRVEPTRAGASEIPTSRTRSDARFATASTDVRTDVAREDAQPQTELRDAEPERVNRIEDDRTSPEPVDQAERTEEVRPPPERVAREEPRASPALADQSDETRVASESADPRNLRSSGLPDYAIGADLELQNQPGYPLAFVRPAISAELAWGRDTPGAFWAAGVRVSAPLGHELQPSAAAPAEDSHVRAHAMDAAVQATLGYAFGRLGLTTQLAAGTSYLRVEALNAERHSYGHDAQFSPLLAAGIGARLSVALGFALAVRGEAQWAGRGTIYRIGGVQVLEGGAFRVGLLAGVLWESALGRAGL